MFKRLIVMILVLGGLVFSQDVAKGVELELVKEIKIDEGIYSIAIDSETKPMDSETKRVKATTSRFPIRAISTDKGVILFDEKGDILKKIPEEKGVSLREGRFYSQIPQISQNGEYIGIKKIYYNGKGEVTSSTFELQDREGKKIWEKDMKELGGDISISPTGWAVSGRRFIDTSGNVIKEVQNLSYSQNWFSDDGKFIIVNGSLVKKETREIPIEEQSNMKPPFSELKPWPLSENKQPIKEEKSSPNKPSNNTRQIFVIETEFKNGLLCYDNRGNELWRWEFPIRAFFDVVDKLAISPNGKYIVLSIRNMFAPENRIYFLDNTGNLLGEYQVGYGECNIAFSPDSEYVAVTDYHALTNYQNVYLFKSISGKLLWQYQEPNTDRRFDTPSITSNKYIVVGCRRHVHKKGSINPRYLYIFNQEGKKIIEENLGIEVGGGYIDTKISLDGSQLTVMTGEKILSYKISNFK